MICSVDNQIPYIIIDNDIIGKLHTQIKYSSGMYINGLLDHDDKEITSYKYSKHIDKKYKSEIEKQLLLCFSKKFNINTKIAEFTLRKKVSELDLKNLYCPQ